MKRMTMLKKVALCATTLFAAFGWAAAPAQDQVTTVAEKLVAQDLQGLLPGRTVNAVERITLEDTLGVWAVKLAPAGHLILADSTKYRPLISFSENDFVAPEADTPQYAALHAAATRVAAAEAADGEENAAWSNSGVSLFATTGTPDSNSITAQPIDTALWYQFNALAWYTPGTAPNGCVATAQSQAMHGLQWPVYPERFFETELNYTDSSSNTTTETYRFTPYSKFDYSKMSNTYADLAANTANNHQVARLALMNDIISKMVFKHNVSTTTVPPATITPWSYNLEKCERANISTEFSEANKTAIQNAMEAGFPVACHTASHAVLASGYATINSVPYVRLNYGYALQADNNDRTTAWYHIDDNDVTTFSITNPTKAVQCDPLPAITSASPTITWYIPKCYAGDYTTDVTGFSVKAVPVTAEAATWTCGQDDFAAGAVAGNTRFITTSKDGVVVNMNQSGYDYPFIYYTLDPLFIPTADSKWNTTYSANGVSGGKVTLQVLPLGGAWENVETVATSDIADATAEISLAKYAGKPCKLRYFINSLNTYSETFKATAISVTATQVVDKSAETETFATIENEKGEFAFTSSFSNLIAGTAYVFAVTPTFSDGTNTTTGTTGYCYTRIADGSTYVEEDFATFEVTSPSTEAQSNENMRIEENFFRYCTYNGTSYIRVNAGANAKTLDVYSSHLTAFPDDAFTVTSYNNGIFDIKVDNTKVPESPRVNDRVNLSLVATTDAGTISSHELSLAFDNSKAVAESEPAAPTLGEDPEPEVELPKAVYTNTLEGDATLEYNDVTYSATTTSELTTLAKEGENNFDRVIYKAMYNDSNDNDTRTHTISMWVKVDSLSDDQILWWVCGGNNGNHSGYAVKAMADGKISIGKTDTDGAWTSQGKHNDATANKLTTTESGLLKNGTWAYLTVVLEKAVGRAITPTLYVDGVQKAFEEGSFSSNLDGEGGSATYAQLGANVSAAGVTVYDAALTAEQVALIDRKANLAIVVEPEPTVTSSFGVNFMTAEGQEVTSAAGFATGSYEAPSTWGNFVGSADGTGEVSSYKVYWTSYGTWKSSCGTDTDNKKLLYGYLDDVANGGRKKATVTITGLPDDKQYAVALILSGDGNGDADFNNRYSPVLINGETYAYDGTTLLVGDDVADVTHWGSRAQTASANGELVEGTNVMFVEGLSGSILSITSAMDSHNVSRLTIAGVQVWITDADAVAPETSEDKDAVSINFVGDGNGGSVADDAMLGLVSAGGWNNLSNNNGISQLKMWDGSAAYDTTMLADYSSNNVYGYANKVTIDSASVYLAGYLDDGGNQVSISVTSIPFTEYSVIVYTATDSQDYKFKPVQVNGTWYAGSVSARGIGYAIPVFDSEKDTALWGATRGTSAVYGTNALRVDGLSGNLTIKGGTNSNSARGGIAAIQIINTGTVLSTPTSTATITGNVNASDIVWDPSDPTAETNAVINVNTDATITMNEAISAATLTIAGEHKLTFAGSEALNTGTVIVDADTDVSALTGTVNLGVVLIEQGKTLTVSSKTEWSAITNNGGTLAYKDYVPADFEYNDANSTVRFDGTATSTTRLGANNGTVEIGAGANITIPHLRFLNRASGNDRVTFNVNGTVNVNSVSVNANVWQDRGSYKGILFGHYYGQGIYNINAGGQLIGNAAYLELVYTAESQTLNVQGGTLQVRGLYANNGNATVNLSQNGTLKLAEFPGGGRNFTQAYGYGTIAAYSYNDSTGWTNPQAVSFVDKDNGTTLDPNDLTIAFTGAITDSASGAKIIVNDTGAEKKGIVNLAGASSLPDTLQYVVNAGTLILPAGKETTATIDGGSLILQLSDEQMATGYTAQVAFGTTVTFYDSKGELIEGDTVNGNTYTPALNTWTATDGTNWSNVKNWSTGATPGNTDNIKIQINADTKLTLPGDISVGIVNVVGSGTLTIAGGKLTATKVIASANITVTGDTLALVPMVINENVTVDYTTTADVDLPELTGEGTFVKRGTHKVTMQPSLACDPVVEVAGGLLFFNNAQYDMTYNLVVKNGALVQLGTWAGSLRSQASVITLEGGAKLILKNGNKDYHGGARIDASVVIESTEENPAIIQGSANGSNSTIVGPVSGTGVLELRLDGDSAYNISGVISGTLKVKVSTTNGVTLSGVNTYTGGTEVAADAVLILGNKAAIPAGALTGEGTVKIAAVANMPEVEIASETWTGTVEITGDLQLANTAHSLEVLGHANSTLKISGKLTGYLAKSKTCTVPVELADGASISIDDGYSNGGYYTFAKVSGSGSITHNRNLDYPIIINDASEFTGTLTITEDYTSAKIVIGNGTEKAVGGAIVVSDADRPAVIDTDKTWKAPNGVVVHSMISGNGTVAGTLTFEEGSTLWIPNDGGRGYLTANAVDVSNVGTAVTVDTERLGLLLKITDEITGESEQEILQKQNLIRTAFTTTDGILIFGTDETDGTGLIRTFRPSAIVDSVEQIPEPSALIIAQAVAEAGCYTAKLSTDAAKSIDFDAVVLFDNVMTVTVDANNEANVEVDYDFGIESITVQNLNGVAAVSDGKDDTLTGNYVVITATVSNGVDATADYADGTAVNLYKDGVLFASAAVITEAEPTPGRVRLAISYNEFQAGENPSSKTFEITVKAANIQPAQ